MLPVKIKVGNLSSSLVHSPDTTISFIDQTNTGHQNSSAVLPEVEEQAEELLESRQVKSRKDLIMRSSESPVKSKPLLKINSTGDLPTLFDKNSKNAERVWKMKEKNKKNRMETNFEKVLLSDPSVQSIRTVSLQSQSYTID